MKHLAQYPGSFRHLWWVVTLAVLVMTTYVVTGRQLMQMAPEWRQPLETLLTKRTGLPLHIGQLSGRMEGLTPVFHLEQVRISAPDGDPAHALTIGRVSVSVDLLMSVLHRSLWLGNLSLSGVKLEFEQGEDGHIRLRGFPRRDQPNSDSGQASLQTFLKLLYQQKQVVLDKVDLTLALKDMPVLATHNLRLEMQSSGERHQLALWLDTETAPLALDLRLRLDRDVYDLSDLSGSAWLSLAGRDLRYWIPATLATRLHLDKMAGHLAFWLRLENGQLASATLRLRVDELALADGSERWEASQVAGLVSVRRHEGYQAQIQGLNFVTSGGLWQSGVLSAGWQTDAEGVPHWKLLLTQLDVDALVRQFSAWPFALPDTLQQGREKLVALAPGARLESLFIAGTGRTLGQLSGQFQDLHVGGGEQAGIAGLGGWFYGTPAAGMVGFEHNRMTLALPAVYDHGLTAMISGILRWQHDANGQLAIASGPLTVVTDDASALAVVGLTFPAQLPPRLHLLADAESNHIERTGFYLPTRHMSESLAHWLTDAIRGGRLEQGRFLYEGPVRIDPTRQQDRTFQMLYRVSGAQLRFLPEWPTLENLTGQVLVDGHRVEGENFSGSLYRSHFERARFEAGSNQPDQTLLTLRVGGRLDAQAEDVGQVLHGTPLAVHLPAELADWQLLQGKAQGSLALEIPLEHGSQRAPRVVAEAALTAGELVNQVRGLVFRKVAGQIQVDLAKGIQVQNLHADWQGSPLSGSVVTRDGSLTLTAQGSLRPASVAAWLQSDWLAQATGEAQTQMRLSLPWKSKQPVVLGVSSDLKGVAIGLPAPLTKPAAASLPFTLTFRDARQLSFQTGKTSVVGFPGINGSFLFEQGQLRGGSLHLGRQRPLLPAAGSVHVTGYVASLNVREWLDWIKALPAARSKDALPFGLTLGVGQLGLYGIEVPKASLGVQVAPDASVNVTLGSEVLAGSLLLPAGFAWRGDKAMQLQVDHLNWAAAPKRKGVADYAPLDMPVADVKLKSVLINGTDYGSWQGKLRPLATGVQVNDLSGQWRHANFAGTLDWTQIGQKQSSHFKGSMTSSDLGALQKDWGFTPQVLSDKAEAGLDLVWPGAPMDMDYLALTGKTGIVVGACRLPQMDSNNSILKVLGALNVSSIGRRLRFDFSDLYKKGLSCDSIKANLSFNNEQLGIEKLHLKSPSADIQMTGSANLKTQMLDADMTVILPLSSNLYAGCLAGPAACAGIFVFDKLLGKRLEKAAALHYRVTGDWSKPEVKEK